MGALWSLLATFHLPLLIGARIGAVGLLLAFFFRSVPRQRTHRRPQNAR